MHKGIAGAYGRGGSVAEGWYWVKLQLIVSNLMDYKMDISLDKPLPLKEMTMGQAMCHL